jgi:hypothetical protein
MCDFNIVGFKMKKYLALPAGFFPQVYRTQHSGAAPASKVNSAWGSMYGHREFSLNAISGAAQLEAIILKRMEINKG